MITIVIPYQPVAWAAPRLSKHNVYDPREKDKRAIRYLVKQQYNGSPLAGNIFLRMIFTFEIPKSTSKAKKIKMLKGDIIPTKCDCTNLQKLYEYCIKNILFADDRNVKMIISSKKYGESGKVEIFVFNEDGKTEEECSFFIRGKSENNH